MYRIKHDDEVTEVESGRTVLRILKHVVVKMTSGEKITITRTQPNKRARTKHPPTFRSPSAD